MLHSYKQSYIVTNAGDQKQYLIGCNKKLSCHRVTARCCLSLNISLSYSGWLEVIETGRLLFENLCAVSYSQSTVAMALSCIICRSGYFQLRQLRPVARSLTADAAKTIVHAFVACRLDYCNSLLHGITDSLFRRLQSIQSGSGTACRRNCDGQTLSLANSVDYLRHFCLRRDSRDGGALVTL